REHDRIKGEEHDGGDDIENEEVEHVGPFGGGVFQWLRGKGRVGSVLDVLCWGGEVRVAG
ncbi:MAG TPA: hypothetical protein VJ893_00340, partial [Roseovarius sp.]|nr:hypothetical protein [Roseovarius sp.]